MNEHYEIYDWISPLVVKPPQGMKILCFDKGDLYVAQRFRDYWFSIPFMDSQFAYTRPPQMWKHIDFPQPYTGKMFVFIGKPKKKVDIDQLEKLKPKMLDEIIEALLTYVERDNNISLRSLESMCSLIDKNHD